ncbi:MAG: RAMP superfamily CRISPR-associated protein, partial [Planctomycetota bacterium]|nr:RAMP superfamily CRISPR-associated protein [Planctomycetota bacterium]
MAKKKQFPHRGLQLGLSDEQCNTSDSHPQLKLMVGFLVKGEMDQIKQRTFGQWREGPKHAKLSDEQLAVSDLLLGIVQERAELLVSGAKQSKENPRQTGGGGQTNQATDYANAADPSVLGEAFHNPYTFLPFGKSPRRHPPTPFSIGEHETDRQSGVLELKISTVSPLLTCSPKPALSKDDHNMYRALTIGNDVIVPATGVRGALRTLTTVLTGGTLGYVDESLFLTQERDVPLGPAGKSSPSGTPQNVFLAEVVSAGTANSPGQIRLGTTRLVKAENLENGFRNRKLPRPTAGNRVTYLWANAVAEHGDDRHAEVSSLSEKQDAEHQWKVKLSGRPINPKSKREGLFLPDGEIIDLPANFWADYQGRNRHADHPELKRGDLVWLQPDDPDRSEITHFPHIKSLQWARWGRAGERFMDLLKDHHPDVIPDSLRDDGLVDEVTDLFGHIPHVGQPHAAPAFSARVRPENLVFYDAKPKVALTTLAPLSSPHPGCVAFYRDCSELDEFAPGRPLRGYKVYRNTKERGDNAPWHYHVQGVYKDGKLKDNGNAQQKINQTCELLNEGITGTLRIAFRDLSKRELALLLLTCSVDWRLGGGKPLGLGHCRVVSADMIRETGERSNLFSRLAENSEDYPPAANIGPYSEAVTDLAERAQLWHASQHPVDKLRYPRASVENKNTVTIGGHLWFGRHAQPRKGVSGLAALHVAPNSELSAQAGGKTQNEPQPLPKHDAND